eukprot:4120818-Lingulodinium_polyedra.AAC.1
MAARASKRSQTCLREHSNATSPLRRYSRADRSPCQRPASRMLANGRPRRSSSVAPPRRRPCV